MFKKALFIGLSGALLISLSSTAFAADGSYMRAELGIGAHGGDPDIEFAGQSDSLDVDTGAALAAGIWFDKVASKKIGGDWLSVGVQYQRLQDSDFSESGSGTILGATITGTLDLEPEIDAFMVNAALRQNEGKFHPYIGGGIGIAQSSVDAALSLTVTVNGQTFVGAGTVDDSDTALAGQFFAGVDYDVTEKIYLGANVKYFLTDATLFDADVEFRTLAGMAVVGYKF